MGHWLCKVRGINLTPLGGYYFSIVINIPKIAYLIFGTTQMNEWIFVDQNFCRYWEGCTQWCKIKPLDDLP